MSKLGGGKLRRKLRREERARTSKWQRRSHAKGVEKPRRNSRCCKNPGTKTIGQRKRNKDRLKKDREIKRAKRKEDFKDKISKINIFKKGKENKEAQKKKSKASVELDLNDDSGAKSTSPTQYREKSKNPRFL